MFLIDDIEFFKFSISLYFDPEILTFFGNVDPVSEKLRNEQKLEKIAKNLATIENTLNNKKFISSAPKSLVNDRKRQYKQALKEFKSIQLHLKNLNKLS